MDNMCGHSPCQPHKQICPHWTSWCIHIFWWLSLVTGNIWNSTRRILYMPYYAFHKSKNQSFFFQIRKVAIKMVQMALLGSCPVCTSLFQNLPHKWQISFRSPNHHCVWLYTGHPKQNIMSLSFLHACCYIQFYNQLMDLLIKTVIDPWWWSENCDRNMLGFNF
jgi:hypothetical protein